MWSYDPKARRRSITVLASSCRIDRFRGESRPGQRKRGFPVSRHPPSGNPNPEPCTGMCRASPFSSHRSSTTHGCIVRASWVLDPLTFALENHHRRNPYSSWKSGVDDSIPEPPAAPDVEAGVFLPSGSSCWISLGCSVYRAPVARRHVQRRPPEHPCFGI